MNLRPYDYLTDESIKATVIADSEFSGTRVTTMVWRVPRFILPQLNTHRVFSRNVASSRAKRFRVLLKDATYKPFLWLANHKGMQADRLVDEWQTWFADAIWTSAKYSAIFHGWLLDNLGVSKQYTNRIIEPYCYVDYLVTSTEWENFFYQRDDDHAQFEIQVIARKAKEAMAKSIPQKLSVHEWHLPFITGEDKKDNDNYNLLRLSAGRCARTSYRTATLGKKYKDEFDFFDRLIFSKPPHLSPVEHQVNGNYRIGMSSNLNGVTQFRKVLEHYNFDIEKVVEFVNNA